MADKGLVEAEGRYRSLIEEAPISLWEEDFTEVSKFIDQLRAGGLGDLRRYFENNPEALGECASKVKVLDVNKCTLEQYGARSKQEFFDNLNIFFCDETYPFIMEEVLAIANGETAFEGETVNKTLQGRKLYVFLKWIVSPGNREKYSRVIVSIVDITERKLAEEELRESELKYKVVADNTYDWEFWLSPDGRFIYNSPSCHRITGLSPDELEADPDLLASIVHPEDLPLFHSHLAEERLLDHPGELEFRIVRPDEELRWIHHVCQPVFASHGGFIGMRGSNRDITERKAGKGAPGPHGRIGRFRPHRISRPDGRACPHRRILPYGPGGKPKRQPG